MVGLRARPRSPRTTRGGALWSTRGQGEPSALGASTAVAWRTACSISEHHPTGPPARAPTFLLRFRRSGSATYGRRERDQCGRGHRLRRASEWRRPSYAASWMRSRHRRGNTAPLVARPEDECPSTSEVCDQIYSDCDGVVAGRLRARAGVRRRHRKLQRVPTSTVTGESRSATTGRRRLRRDVDETA